MYAIKRFNRYDGSIEYYLVGNKLQADHWIQQPWTDNEPTLFKTLKECNEMIDSMLIENASKTYFFIVNYEWYLKQ